MTISRIDQDVGTRRGRAHSRVHHSSDDSLVYQNGCASSSNPKNGAIRGRTQEHMRRHAHDAKTRAAMGDSDDAEEPRRPAVLQSQWKQYDFQYSRQSQRRHLTRSSGSPMKTLLVTVAIALLVSLARAAEPIMPTTSSSTSGAPGGTAAPSSSTSANASATGTLSSIPSSVPNGGITILQPQQTAAQSYYKIASGSNVTFAWNFTDVLRYPSSLVVAAYCSENSNTYTFTSSLPGTATSFVWSPYDYDQSAARFGQAQLIQATYRLQITDERGLNVAASPGLFSPNSKVTFALYQPRPYVPISQGWTCASCNAGASLRIPGKVVLAVSAAAVSAACLL